MSWLLWSLLACGGDPATDDSGQEPELEQLFSFAVIADPHITTDTEAEERFSSALEWVDEHAGERDIAMTFVLGDIGWGEGLQTARDLLDAADVPYVPVIGDNVIQAGDEERFDAMFAERYEQLGAMFPGWTQASTPSHNPEHDTDSWFQNFSFDHQGVHFVGLDWCSREMGTLFSEIGTLHDFEGGSWPWFEADIDAVVAQGGAEERVVMLTHIPMFMGPGGFDEADWAEIVGFTSPRADAVAANYAGHFHGNTEESFSDAGFDLYITDATWDDEVTVRLVEVWGNGLRFEYHGEVVEWDW